MDDTLYIYMYHFRSLTYHTFSYILLLKEILYSTREFSTVFSKLEREVVMSFHTLFILLNTEIFVVSSFSLIARIFMSITFFSKHPTKLIVHLVESIEREKKGNHTNSKNTQPSSIYQGYRAALERNQLSSPLLLLLAILSSSALMLWG